MASNLKKIILLLVHSIVNLFISPSKEVKQNSLLLIRLDAIGDYLLFRNFIELIKTNKKYANYEITLLGNIAWKDFSKELDYEFIDEFFWLDRNKFNKNLIYRYKKLNEIVSIGYEIVINSAYSREFFYSDSIVKLVTAYEKIGSASDASNLTNWQTKISNKYYSKLISTKNEPMFEFNRNKDFFEKLLEDNVRILRPQIKLRRKKLSFNLQKNYAIIFIGASKTFRKWPIKNYAEVALYLHKVYEYEIVLCGAVNDIKEARAFEKFYYNHFIDLVGKTSLMELAYLIKDSKILVSNETVAPHIAVALNVKNIFVLSNGNHLGRFSPYPKNITSNYHTIYHPKILNNFEKYDILTNQFRYGSSLNISEISTENVIKKISMIL